MNDVSMFVPCAADVMLPEIGEAMFYLLRRLGKSPVYHEEQTCCGQPAVNAGYRKHAVEAAKHFIDVFEKDEVIVCPSGSCVSTVKHQYPELLQDSPEWSDRARATAGKVFELTQYIVDVLGIEDVDATFNGKIAYHESCQNLRNLGIVEQPKKLIGAVKGAQLVPLNAADVCCGFGGEFSFAFPSISEAIVKDKTDNFISSAADVLILSEPGCLLNVSGYLSRHHPDKKAMHIAKERNIKYVTKGKSMVTEETGLNETLIKKGVEAFETDLGELIIQLLGRPPFHIVGPAINVPVEEVRDIFMEKGVMENSSDDPTELAFAARLFLRDKFHHLEMGISCQKTKYEAKVIN